MFPDNDYVYKNSGTLTSAPVRDDKWWSYEVFSDRCIYMEKLKAKRKKK